MTARHPYEPTATPRFDRELFKRHEAANRRAADQYRRYPISLHRIGESTACHGCGRNTVAKHGWCRACWEAL